MLWDLPICALNQGVHTYLYEEGVRLMRETSASSSEKQEIASLMGIEI
jgi:hypothetical protein